MKRKHSSHALSSCISSLEDETKSSLFLTCNKKKIQKQNLHAVAIQDGQKFQSDLLTSKIKIFVILNDFSRANIDVGFILKLFFNYELNHKAQSPLEIGFESHDYQR